MAISVVINTYNAEKHLKKVLDSVKNFDEIVICDMESTDNTVSIANEYGCKVVTFPKGDCVSAEPARTFAIQSASSEWVLVVDADEIVSDELRKYLYDFTRKNNNTAGLWIPRKNYFMGQFMHAFYPDYILRFFKREGTVWPAEVHTFPTVQGPTTKIPRKRKDLAFEHLANDSVYDCIRKINQYTENEVKKKSGKHYGAAALIFKPAFRFFKAYILKKGFLDGKAGFINACIQAVYQITMLGKIVEKEYQNPS
ncbi:MAG: glycosyltransferase family 2 protein [Bacteroidaceae bacterium]|jgi:glycosyltransferase involved in cell wall biosynthesis|nr:glycosyltransferase family 2 protein [Bacteroidaceae bacterium]